MKIVFYDNGAAVREVSLYHFWFTVRKGVSVTLENEIKISQVNKFYGKKHALKNVDLVIPQGMFGLLGRNGA